MKRPASHNDVIEAGHFMDLSPEGSAKGRVKERKRVEAQKWLEDAVLQAAKDMYAAWKRRGGPEPSLTTSLLRDLAIEGTGGLPEDIKWMTKRQQDLAVLNALQKLKRKGLMEVSTGAGQRGGEAKVWNPVSASTDVIATLLAVADYFDPAGEVEAEFKRPHDAWKGLKPGKQPLPQPLEGHEKAWKKIAARLGIDPARGVMQLAPVIGGRRRYHHRPLTSWLLPDKKTTLTLTTDKLEGQSWNRLKNKRHVAMPRIHDVFELRLSGVPEPLWAIVHERVTWPVDPDWDLFVDTLFRWRAMQKNALTPAQPKDLEDFLRFVIDPEKSDPVTTRRRRVETALPFKMMNDRRADIAARRKAVWKDPGLEAKIDWAKSTLKFLRANKIRHRDLDPSNLAKTLKGRTVVTNVAESRSKGKKIGRLGRVSSAVDPVAHDPFGPTPVAPALRTAQAINMLLDPEAPLMEQLQILSTETRNLNMQIHQDTDMRAAVQEAAFQVGYPQDSILRGLEKLADVAERSGGKAVALVEACLAKLAPTLSLPPPPVIAALDKRDIKERLRRLRYTGEQQNLDPTDKRKMRGQYERFVQTLDRIVEDASESRRTGDELYELMSALRHQFVEKYVQEVEWAAEELIDINRRMQGDLAEDEDPPKPYADEKVSENLTDAVWEMFKHPIAPSVDGGVDDWIVIKAAPVDAAGWRKVKTPEQRSQAAQKAAQTRKARQVPVEVKINNVPIAGAYYPAYQGKVDEGHIYFTSRNVLKKLGKLPMVKVGEYTDDYAGDAARNFGRGETATLAELLARRPRYVNLSLDKPGARYDGRVGWFLHVSIHQNESWDSAEPVVVQVRSAPKFKFLEHLTPDPQHGNLLAPIPAGAFQVSVQNPTGVENPEHYEVAVFYGRPSDPHRSWVMPQVLDSFVPKSIMDKFERPTSGEADETSVAHLTPAEVEELVDRVTQNSSDIEANMTMMGDVAASTNYYKKKRRVRRAAKMKKIVDTLVNVAEYLED